MTLPSNVSLGLTAQDPLSAIMNDLKNQEFASIGHEVLTLVSGAPTGPSPAAAQAELVDAGLSFLLGLVTPLQECLELVTGDTASLAVKAEYWQTLAVNLRHTVPQIADTAASTRATWTGAASAAFDATMQEFTPTVSGAAAACDGVAMLLQTSAELMTGAQNLIAGILGQVIEYMIVADASAAASSIFTFGASAAVAQASIIGETAEGIETAVGIVDRVAALLARIARALADISAVFAQVTALLARLTKQTAILSTQAPVAGYSLVKNDPSPLSPPSPAGTSDDEAR